MSSSSSYEPDDDDASDSDIETRPARAHVPPSSPPTRSRQASPSHEPTDQTSGKINLREKRGTRDQVLNDLYASLGQESADAYNSLLEDAVGDLVPSRSPTDENYNATQNGIVIWTPQEKQVFYNWLHRKGRNGIAEIASAIGTKSELEVQEFLRLLHRGLERQHLRDRHTRTIILGDVPAAADIGRKCCAALDQYAELLALEEQQAEDDVGRARNHDLWIIDRDNAQEVDDDVQDAEKADAQLDSDSSVYHTAGLFNMSTWIRLSERFFMNPGGARMDDNWVNVGFAGESPSMTADAFADFYTLAVSVTRRLIHSTLFFAMSRLRNMRETGNAKARVVRSRDVHTALDVLGMKRDRVDHWVGLARRCNLTVEDVRNRRGWKPILMDLDEVEDILSGRAPYDAESRERSMSNHGQYPKRSASDEPEDGYNSENEDEDESARSSRESSVLSSPAQSLPDNESQAIIDPEDAHAEQLDQEASHLEESHLWEILGQPHLKTENHTNTTTTPKGKRRPVGERKTQDDLVNWRDRTLYRSDWEEHGHDTVSIYEEIAENRRKRRRLLHQVSSVPDDSDSDDIHPAADSAIPHSEDNDDDNSQIYPQMEVDNNTNKTPIPTPAPTQNPKQEPNQSQSQPIIPKARSSRSPEPKNEQTSSSEDDDLPSARKRSRSLSLGDGDGDDDGDGKVDSDRALFSRPMSPLAWDDG